MGGNLIMKRFNTLLVITLLFINLCGCSNNNMVGMDDTDTPTSTSAPSSTTTQQSASDSTTNDKYFSSIIIDGDLAYFDVTIDEFIAKYNQMVENSPKEEIVKELMKLSTEPKLLSVTDDGANVYDVTNPVISTNRSAVGTTLTTLIGSSNIYSVNFDIPNTAGPNTDITDSVILTLMALIGDDVTYTSGAYNDLRSIGLGYYKGLLMAYYKQPTADVYRIKACTEEHYNQIK